jgi:hypothetical protein
MNSTLSDKVNGFFEQEVAVPMAVAFAEQGAGADLDLQPILDRLEFNSG